MPTDIQRENFRDGERIRVAVPAGETSPVLLLASDVEVSATPGAGGSMLVEATWSMPTAVRAGAPTANWHPWNPGAAGVVTGKATDRLFGATALRFTAIGAIGVGEVSASARTVRTATPMQIEVVGG